MGPTISEVNSLFVGQQAKFKKFQLKLQDNGDSNGDGHLRLQIVL